MDGVHWKFEEAVSPEAALSLGRQAEYHYACLVQEAKKERTLPETVRNTNSNISLCKDYIFSHLHEKIRISDIAKELYLNPNYLPKGRRDHHQRLYPSGETEAGKKHADLFPLLLQRDRQLSRFFFPKSPGYAFQETYRYDSAPIPGNIRP